MHRLLSAWDLRVEATDNVEAALDRLRAGGAAPDLIVVDHRLPGTKSGIDVLRQFADIAGRDIPALIVTGDTSTSQLRAMEAAGYPYLYKPVDPEMLRATISALLASDEVARTRAGA
jgi:CheY-like chemotaxis protein